MSTISIPNRSLATIDDEALAALRSRIAGDVIRPDDADYTSACAAWNLCFAHAPDLVVIAGSVADISEVVRFAHAAGCPVTVQATGHGFSRPATDGILLVTSRLTDVEIDRRTLTAKVACGAKWAAVLAPAQQHGLAPLLGSTTDVGAVGYTLGGGMGWLGRRYGLASDSVRSFEVVLSDGTEVHASAIENEELFWALRGGGGSFGVVTAMTIELYPVGMVYAGNLLYPVEMAAEVITRYRDWVIDIDDQLTSSVAIMNFPPLDIVPEPVRGKSFVIVRGCWCGDVADGEALIDEWRRWRTPALDMFGAMPFSMADTISNDPVDPMPAIVTTEWFDALADEAIDVIVAAAVPSGEQPPMMAFAELRHAGGAIRAKAARVANRRGRSGEFLLEMVGLVFGPEHGEVMAEFFSTVRGALAPFVNGAAYHNFLEGEEKHARSVTAFTDGDLARLRAVKAAIDSDNRFRNALGI
jgi:hypothetical protein